MHPLQTSEKARRSRTGCQACRQRKKKCDERRPLCGGCESRCIACTWPPVARRQQRLARRISPYNKDYTVPTELLPHINVFAVPSRSTNDQLMSYFIANGWLWLTTTGDQKACMDVIMPIALRSQVVNNCVLLMAAGDMHKYQSVSSDFGSLTRSLYSQVLSGINSSIDNPQVLENEEDILTAIILLCVHETVNFSSTDRLIPHLNAAVALSASPRMKPRLHHHLRRMLFEVFLYIYTLTAFSHRLALRLDLATSIFEPSTLHEHGTGGLLLGNKCIEIFSFILRISMMFKQPGVLSIERNHVTSELKYMQARLMSYEVSSRNLTAEKGLVAEQETLSELYRLACLIYVSQMLQLSCHSSPADSLDVKELVSRFVMLVHLLPISSTANNIMCWPLTVVGLFSTEGSHRRTILGRLRQIHETWRSDILSKTVDYLSSFWEVNTLYQGASRLLEGPRNWSSLDFPAPLL